MSVISSSVVKKNLNRLIGSTVTGIAGDDVSFSIIFTTPAGEEIEVNHWNAYGLKKKDAKEAIALTNVITLKHKDDCTEMGLYPDKVVGAVLRNVNVYTSKKGVYTNRISLSFQLGIIDTNHTPGIMISTDLSSSHSLSD